MSYNTYNAIETKARYMLIGYARTSTVEQEAGLQAQIRDLETEGVEKLFSEQVSSVQDRHELNTAIEFVREGDTLIVTKLDRLARSTSNLLDIVNQLEAKKVGLKILDFGGSKIDTKSPTGKLMLTMFAAMAQFEREMMLERQREGIAKAKREGKYKGRKPTARAKISEVIDLHRNGVGATEIAKRLSIGRASVYRLLQEAQK